MKRIVTLTLGDWSSDGHSMTKTFIVKLSGDDVSDEAIRRNRKAAETAIGFPLESICEEWKDNYLRYEQLEQLLTHGLIVPGVGTNPRMISERKIINVLPEDFEALSGVAGIRDVDAVTLALSFAGYGDPSFSWEPVEIDNILGGYGDLPLGSSFGYGLFYS